MRTLLVLSLLGAPLARADDATSREPVPLRPRTIFVGGFASAPALADRGMTLEAGLQLPPTRGIFAHALVGAGPRAEWGDHGSYRLARAGVEGRICRRWLGGDPRGIAGGLTVGCIVVGVDLGIAQLAQTASLHGSYHVAAEIGDHVRMRIGFEQSLYYRPGTMAEKPFEAGGGFLVGAGAAF